MQELHQPTIGFCKTTWPKGHSLCPHSNELRMLINCILMISNTKIRFLFWKLLLSAWNHGVKLLIASDLNQYLQEIFHTSILIFIFFIKHLIRNQGLELQYCSVIHFSTVCILLN